MSWTYLLIAGLLEIVWAVGLKYTEGFKRPMESAVTVAAMIGSMFLLSLALRTLPVGTAYAIWTGIGAVGTAIAGMILFDESREALRIVCIVMIVAGIIGLKFVSSN